MNAIFNAVIIDDEMSDILGIAKCLAGQGISTLPVHYNDPAEAYGVCKKIAPLMPRVIITDIQMNASASDATNYSNIAQCIELIVGSSIGPYVVLTWTSKPDQFEALKSYIHEYFEKKDVARPFFFGSIDKSECKPNGTDYDAREIFSKFSAHMDTSKELSALMHWEIQVLRASIETVNTLAQEAGGDLRRILCALGEKVMGKNLAGNEASALNESLSYVLRDKINLYSENISSQEVWEAALKPHDSGISDDQVFRLNALLHLDKSQRTGISHPGDVWHLGDPRIFFNAICKTNESRSKFMEVNEDFLVFDSAHRDLTKQLMSGELPNDQKDELKTRLKEEYTDPHSTALKSSMPFFIEVSPLCDFAEKKKKLRTFAYGLMIRYDTLSEKVKIKKSESIISMPIRYDDNKYFMCLSAKYLTAFTDSFMDHEDNKAKRIFRVRESMLQSWIHKIASYNSRIGTVSFAIHD